MANPEAWGWAGCIPLMEIIAVVSLYKMLQRVRVSLILLAHDNLLRVHLETSPRLLSATF